MHSIEWSTSASTVGSKKRPGPSPALPPVITRAPFSTASSTWLEITSICGGKVIAPMSTVPGAGGRALAQRLDALGEKREELVVDGLLDVDALDRDAGLARVADPVGDGGVDGALEVGVGEHDHRVLAAELEARPASASRRRAPSPSCRSCRSR